MEDVPADGTGWNKMVFKVLSNPNCDSMIYNDISYIPTASSAVFHIFLSIKGPPVHPSVRKFSVFIHNFGGGVGLLLETLKQRFI